MNVRQALCLPLLCAALLPLGCAAPPNQTNQGPSGAPTPAAPGADAQFQRAQALFAAGDPVAAVRTLVERERRLTDPGAIAANREAIWNGLVSAHVDATTVQRAASADPVTRGWIELANLVRIKASLELFEAWRERYPDHPGQERLAALLMPNAQPAVPAVPAPAPVAPSGGPFQTLPARAGFYALLLPQSGPLAALGAAVRNGFTEAATRAGAGVSMQTYDVASAGVLPAYQRALADGAGLIVGPLTKDDVAALDRAGPRVPVLALNYLDATQPPAPGFYQFGLAPEDEARAAAEDAYARGLKRALALVPDNDWGRRVLGAFQSRLAELGGRVVGAATFGGDIETWAEPIRALLHYRVIDDKKKLEELRAKAPPGTDPQRRNDFDFLFVAASAAQARIIWPEFKYYHAERMPIYATSSVNEGPGDFDLAGISFCDAPWLLDSSGLWTALRQAAENGRSRDLARFYAMGDDAFVLAQRLAQNGLHPFDELPGATGTLRVGADGAIHRGLICARTTTGEPQLLPPAAPVAPEAAPAP
jgi:outer membrane PBP1 activator LpoA protein